MTVAIRRAVPSISTALVSIWLGTTALAGDIRVDRPDSSYTNLAAQPQFNGVGTTDFYDYTGATLVGPNWVLTAGHVFNANYVTFGTPGNLKTYTVLQSIAAPGWSGDFFAGNDLRLLKIDGNPINDGKASVIFPLYNGPLIDKVITNVGYGLTGNGQTGFQPNTGGTRRAGNMVARSYILPGSTDLNSSATYSRTNPTGVIVSDFIDPTTGFSPILSIINGTTTTTTAQDLEYMLAQFDSGSPGLINDNGVWKIAGVASFIATQNSSNPQDPNFGPQGIYGDLSGYTVFSDATYQWAYNIAVPEPSSIALLSMIACGGAGYGWHYYRRQRRNQGQSIPDSM